MPHIPEGSFTRHDNGENAVHGTPQKMGTGPNGHGTPLMVLTPLTAMALAPSHVNCFIGNNETYFCHGNGNGAVPSRVNGP